MNFLGCLLLLATSLSDQAGGVLIHTPPAQRAALDSIMENSDAIRSLDQLGIDLSTPNLVELLQQPIADSEPDRKWYKVYAVKALAERKATGAIPALLGLTNEVHLRLRVESAIALSRIDPEQGRRVLRQILQDQSVLKESYFRAMEVATVLADLGDGSGYDLVKHGLMVKEWQTAAVIFLPTFAKVGIDVLPQLLDALEKAVEGLEVAERSAGLRFHWTLIGLQKLGDARALQKLEEVAKRVPLDRRPLVEKTAQKIYLSDADNLIRALKGDPDKWKRVYAAWRLGEKGETRALPDLAQALEHEHVPLQLEAALALVRLGDERGRSWFQRAFQTPALSDSSPALYVAGALAELGDNSGFELVKRVLAEGSWARRYEAIKVLPAFRHAQVDLTPHLLQALDLADQAIIRREEEETQRWAQGVMGLGLNYLRHIGDARALPKLQQLSQSADPQIRDAARKALRQVQGQSPGR